MFNAGNIQVWFQVLIRVTIFFFSKWSFKKELANNPFGHGDLHGYVARPCLQQVLKQGHFLQAFRKLQTSFRKCCNFMIFISISYTPRILRTPHIPYYAQAGDYLNSGYYKYAEVTRAHILYNLSHWRERERHLGLINASVGLIQFLYG